VLHGRLFCNVIACSPVMHLEHLVLVNGHRLHLRAISHIACYCHAILASHPQHRSSIVLLNALLTKKRAQRARTARRLNVRQGKNRWTNPLRNLPLPCDDLPLSC